MKLKSGDLPKMICYPSEGRVIARARLLKLTSSNEIIHARGLFDMKEIISIRFCFCLL